MAARLEYDICAKFEHLLSVDLIVMWINIVIDMSSYKLTYIINNYLIINIYKLSRFYFVRAVILYIDVILYNVKLSSVWITTKYKLGTL